jgi:hypothetical protein
MIDDFNEDLTRLVKSIDPSADMSPETTEAVVAGLYREPKQFPVGRKKSKEV